MPAGHRVTGHGEGDARAQPLGPDRRVWAAAPAGGASPVGGGRPGRRGRASPTGGRPRWWPPGATGGGHLGHRVVGGGDDQDVDPGGGIGQASSPPRGAPRAVATRAVERRQQRPAGPARADDTECGHRDPFRRSSPGGCRSRQENPELLLRVYPRPRTSPPAAARSSASTRSGASSARGASTNRRSRNRGWGTVRSGSSRATPVDPRARRRRGSAGPSAPSAPGRPPPPAGWHCSSSR